MNRTNLTCILLLLIGLSVFSQDRLSGVDISKIRALEDTVLFNNVIQDIRIFVAEEQFERSQNLAYQLIEVGNHINYKRGLGLAFKQKGIIENALLRNIESDRSFQKSASYFKEVNDIQELAGVYNDRYVIEKNKGNLEKAADYLLESKLHREQISDSLGLSGTYNNLAILYKELKNYSASEKYYLKAISLRKKLKTRGVGMVMNNLALLYAENKELFKAEVLLRKAIKINKSEKDLRHIAQSYSIIAKVAMYDNDFKTAKKYYDTTKCTAGQANYKLLVTNAKQQLGIIALYEKEYSKSKELLTEAREELVKANVTSLILKNYKYSFKLDSARGQLLGALNWQKKYQELTDKKMNDIASKKVKKAKEQYETQLKQLKFIEEQEKNELANETKMFQLRLVAYISLALGIIIFVFLVLIVRTRNERKRLIAKLDNSNQVKNKLFSIISHDLKNEINGLEGSLNLLKNNSISDKEFKEIIPLLANGTHQTSILLHNLLNWSKSQLKELNANPGPFDISEVINDKFAFFKNKAEQKGVQLINELNPTHIYADKDMFGIVAQNLIANAIKFCDPGDSISLISKEKDNHYEISFKDTGVGINPDNIQKLFAEDTFTTQGTQNESGTGLGLKICKELIELNKGNISVESTLGEGSTFSISLPKAA